MKCVHKRHHAVAAGMPPRQLQGGLDRLGAAVGEKDPLLARARGEGRQPLRQPDLRSIVKIGPRHVDQAVRLPADRRDDPRMRVPDIGHRDPRREVQKTIAVHVFDHRPPRAAHHQRVRPRVRRRHHPIIALPARPHCAVPATVPQSAARRGSEESFLLPSGFASFDTSIIT